MVANVTNDVATSFKKFSTLTNEVATITKEVMVAVGKLTRWSRRQFFSSPCRRLKKYF